MPNPPSSDIALRKKKNADAQAAFRARRANYISTLEETVTNLESIVLQLQDSCREARTESQQLRQENERLHFQLKERERFWRAFCSRKPGSDEELPQLNQYASPYIQQQPSYPVDQSDPTQRLSKYPTYFSPISRDAPWPHSLASSSSGSGDSAPSDPPSHSPNYIESPTITSASDIAFNTRFPVEEQKVPLDTNPYVFSASRSISPSSTPTSSSASLIPPFQFPVTENNSTAERSDYEYPQRHTSEVTLHGGTADISMNSNLPTDAVRYRLGLRQPAIGATPVIPGLPPLSTPENSLSDTDATRPRLRRGTAPSRSSRSPSPATLPTMTGTLAVIKAQAFGALRRTRTKPKKPNGAVKVAIDVLEARGIGMGVQAGTKRPRSDDEGS